MFGVNQSGGIASPLWLAKQEMPEGFQVLVERAFDTRLFSDVIYVRVRYETTSFLVTCSDLTDKGVVTAAIKARDAVMAHITGIKT